MSLKHHFGRNLFRIARDNLGNALRMMIDKGQAIAAVPFVTSKDTGRTSEIVMVIVDTTERDGVITAIVGALNPELRGHARGEPQPKTGAVEPPQ